MLKLRLGQADRSYDFNLWHVLIPTTIRESIIHIRRRRRLHLRAAQAIEAAHPDEFEVLGYQYTEAGELQRASGFFYARAGDRALAGAPAEAARFYQSALDLWAIDSDQAGRVDLLARLGYCLWVTVDDTEGSLKCFETAYTLFDQLGKPQPKWRNAAHDGADVLGAGQPGVGLRTITTMRLLF